MKKWRDEVDFFHWKACFHEAAHTAVARHLGDASAHFRVWKNPSADPEQRPVIGRAYTFVRWTPEQRRLVGLAGPIAEYIEGQPDHADAWGFIDLVELEVIELSESDLKMAHGYGEADVETCIDLVRSLWDKINTIAGYAYKAGPRDAPDPD